jgi:hypothetical protein
MNIKEQNASETDLFPSSDEGVEKRYMGLTYN